MTEPSEGGRGLVRLGEVGATFLRLGVTSFGGPIAHLGYFRREIVENRRWLRDADYADLVALCQLLPGPTSSQVVFGIGMRRAGVAGALVASACFMLPSALLMTVFAYGVASIRNLSGAGWLHGLKLAAVAVVARAVWGMAGALCPDWTRRAMALAAAAFVFLVPGTPSQVGSILVASLVGWWLLGPSSREPARSANGGSRTAARVCLALFASLLVVLPSAARLTGSRDLAIFDSFYRAGALVFGGGHVVLPLLRSELVPSGWVSDSTFLAGYGAVQAVPGPLFTFAAFLGTVMSRDGHAWTGGVLALLAIFLPGWLLVAGALPYWGMLRDRRWFGGAVRGANAAVVGVLLAALVRPVGTESIAAWPDAVLAGVGYALLRLPRVPAWAVVALMAAAGQWILR